MNTRIDIIDDPGLTALATELASQPYFALDTEFIGERTYYAKLALIQVAYPGIDPVLIDPLQISDWAPFHRVLSDATVIKILHSGRQDVEILFHQMGRVPRKIYDTQIAASLCGFGAQIGYADLVKRILGCQIDKGDAFSNWLQRPLTADQMSYARDDVRYLYRIYEALNQRLDQLGRMSWLEAELSRQFDAGRFVDDPEAQWTKIKQTKRLARRHWVVMKDLAAWRLGLAQRLDRPVRFFLSDEALVQACQMDVLELDDLKTRRAFARFPFSKYGAELVEVHTSARRKPKSQWPQDIPRKRCMSHDAELQADLAWVIIQSVARRNRVAPTKIIKKRDLPRVIEEISRTDSDAPPAGLNGWRWSLIGPTLRRLVSGDLHVGIQDGSVVWQHCSFG